MTQVRMNALSIGGLIQLNFSGPINVPANGIITIDARDAPTVLRMGGTYVSLATRSMTFTAPIVGAVGKIVASVAFTNSTYAIANQPDFPRGVALHIEPGTVGFTAGQVVASYVAADGTSPQLDTFGLAGVPATAVYSVNLTKGVMFVNSVIATNVGGGVSPTIQMDTLNFLAPALDPGFVDFSVLNLTMDAARLGVASTIASSGLFLPSTLPNSTRTYNVVYNYVAGSEV